ncbi:MAG TPA: hypothetical protein VL197_02000 [Nitrospirota bacterium]|nr:hypothetical protein [Nitrospirota bacterium]
MQRMIASLIVLFSMSVVLAACGGGDGSSVNVGYSISGTVSGLSGTGLVLQVNSGDNLAVSTNGTFTFASKVADEGRYEVEVKSQPKNPSQLCLVTQGSGTVSGADVSNVTVDCHMSIPRIIWRVAASTVSYNTPSVRTAVSRL